MNLFVKNITGFRKIYDLYPHRITIMNCTDVFEKTLQDDIPLYFIDQYISMFDFDLILFFNLCNDIDEYIKKSVSYYTRE